jgi:hypothetical protein
MGRKPVVGADELADEPAKALAVAVTDAETGVEAWVAANAASEQVRPSKAPEAPANRAALGFKNEKSRTNDSDGVKTLV